MQWEFTPQKVIDRLLERIEIDEAGCWISLYSVGSHGYSQVTWWTGKRDEGGKTRVRLGHRVSWEALHGPIPGGLTIDHICRVRRCINPEHLRLLSNLANATDTRRATEAPVPIGKTCGKGLHELLRYPSGAVACRECAKDRSDRKELKNTTCDVCGKEFSTSRSRREHVQRTHQGRFNT
jgi:HNH endonuclease